MIRRSKLIMLSLLSTGVLFAGCSSQPSTTESQSNGTIGEISDTQLLPSGVQGTKKLTLAGNGLSVQDDGMRDVFVKDINAADISQDIIRWLTTKINPATHTAQQVKQATITVGGSSFVIPEGAVLAPYLTTYNATTTTSGNDLVINGVWTQDPYESYVVIKNTLPENYLVTNPRDWFGPSVYMIPKDSYSLLKLQWGSTAQSMTLRYDNKNMSQSLAMGYEDRYAGQSIPYERIVVPEGVSVRLAVVNSSPTMQVYHLTLKAGSAGVGNMGAIEKQINKKAIAGLRDYLSQNNLTIDAIDTLNPNSSGEWTTKTTSATEQLIVAVESTYSYMFPIHNEPFTLKLEQDTNDQNRPYRSRFVTTHYLDEEVAKAELTKLFGDKNFTYEPRDKGFIYQIQPKKEYKQTLRIRNIFGQEATVDAKYYIDAIDKRAITQDIVSNNTISILPKSGSFKDVLIQYKNIEKFPVSFQSCTINMRPNMFGEYKGASVENYLFDCRGAIVQQEIKPQGEAFTYRKAFRTPLSIPAALSGSSAFKVFFTNQRGETQSHYMLKSDIGVRTKIANNQLKIRGFTFDDGKPLTEGTVNVTTLDGKTIGTATISNGTTTIDLPKNSDTDMGQSEKDTYVVQVSTANEKTFVLVHKGGWSDLSIAATSPKESQRYLKIESKLEPTEVIPSTMQLNQRDVVQPLKIYGYTDRGLYKAGDTIHFGGWARNVMSFGSLDYLKDKTVSVMIYNPMGGDPITINALPLDKYGGFVGSYQLPKTLTLGDYMIEYRLDAIDSDQIIYAHNIKIEEYQKPTFFVNMTHQTKDGMVALLVEPAYFFGTSLKAYDLQVNWSLVGKDICWYCRWRNNEQYYFNHVFNDTISTGGAWTLYNQTAEQLMHPLYAEALQANKGYQYTLKVDAIIKDRLSDETQFVTKYIDFKPQVMLGLAGQPYEWLYRDGMSKDPRENWKLEGKIADGKSLVDTLHYEVYRWSYDEQLQQGIDGNLYYINGQGYIPVTSGDVKVSENFTIPGGWITKPGEYFVRVVAQDKQKNIIGEVQKRVSRYQSSAESDLLGAVPNNYTLTVDIPKKTYEEGDEIPVNLVPYQRGAWVVITVEKGQYVIDSFMKQLDGKQLTIPVKKGYAPSIVVNVMMLQGTQINDSVRKEPRFFAGYAQAEVSTKMHTLNISVETDKKTYAPGDKVTMTVKTTDDAGRAVDARVSLSVVDQALVSLYQIIKEPIPYFFNKVGTSVFTYTNMKLLYQSLRVFATGGSKGGGGQGGKAMFSYIRDELKDAAFWSGAIYTKDGKATLSFIAPENLTTWLIDVIGITMDTRLGTTTAEFVVKKDLIIEPNAPLFVTIGDKLQVPVKVLVPEGAGKGGNVKGSAWIENQYGEKVELGTFNVAPNKTLGLDITIPQARWTSAYIQLVVEGSYGSSKDGIRQTIPLRSEGLMSRDSVGVVNKAGTHEFGFPESLTQSASVRLSQLPTNFIEPVAKYLIRYPYGCTEQLLSSLLPLVALEKLHKQGVFASSVLSGDTVITENGPVQIQTALQDGISKLLANQRSSGGFGYWPGDEGNDQADVVDLLNALQGGDGNAQGAVSRANYILSAYVYSSLKLLATTKIMESQVLAATERLQAFLKTYRTVAPEGWYWYLLTKVSYGEKLDGEEQSSLGNIAANEQGYLPLLRYLIAVAQKDTDAIKTRRRVANIPTNTEEWSDTSVFFNPISAEAMRLRALIDDPQATQQERSDALLSLLSRREKNGLRGWSTQSNVQVMLTLTKLAEFRQPKGEITCDVTINDEKFQVVVSSGSEGAIDFPLPENTAKINRSCDAELLADISVSYLPKKLEDLLGAANHVSEMVRSISDPKASIGSTVEIIGSFATDIAGEQVAVELFVPSDYKLLNVISSKQSQQVPFTTSDPHCTPTHRETRFDRLFLYYDILEAGVCDITIPALKAYNGTTTIMPMRVREMYKGKVNGRKVIVR